MIHKLRPFFPLLTLVGALVCILVSVACSKKTPPATSGTPTLPPVEVATAPVLRTAVERSLAVTGTLFGREEATISAKVGGRVVQVLRDVEDLAPSGEPIIQIDRTDYELALAERRASLLAALAKLGLSEIPGPEFDLASVPTVQRAHAESANVIARLERASSLFNQQPPLISAQDFADIQTQAEVSRQSAEVELLTARSVLADARTLAAAIATTQQQIDDTTVRAPRPVPGDTIQYRVSQRLASLGELVSPGQALVRLVAADVIKFRGQVPERFVEQVVRGRRASIAVDASKDPFDGLVTRVSPRIEPRTRAFEVEIEIQNAQDRLKPGAFATAAVVVESDTLVTLVPPEAVVTFAGVRRVFSIADGKAIEHRIEIGETYNGMIEIIGDLKADAVVVRGAQTLSKGRGVTITQTAEAPKPK